MAGPPIFGRKSQISTSPPLTRRPGPLSGPGHPSAGCGPEVLAGHEVVRADGLAAIPNETPARIVLEHASGTIDVLVDYDMTDTGITLNSAGLIRTARLLARGEVMIPKSIWAP